MRMVALPKPWCKVILMSNMPPRLRAGKEAADVPAPRVFPSCRIALVSRGGERSDAGAAAHSVEGLLQAHIRLDRFTARRDQQVDLIGRELEARLDGVEPGA